MPARPPKVALMTTPDETEAQFYEALQRGDLDRVMAVWADDDDIACIHPSGPRLLWVLATHVFVKTPQGWRLLVHHASPGSAGAVQEVGDEPSMLH